MDHNPQHKVAFLHCSRHLSNSFGSPCPRAKTHIETYSRGPFHGAPGMAPFEQAALPRGSGSYPVCNAVVAKADLTECKAVSISASRVVGFVGGGWGGGGSRIPCQQTHPGDIPVQTSILHPQYLQEVLRLVDVCTETSHFHIHNCP